MKVARLTVLRGEFDGRAETEHRGEIEIGLIAHRLDADFEQLAQPLDRVETRQGEGIRAERRRELALLLVLGEGVGRRVLVADSFFERRLIIGKFSGASMGNAWVAALGPDRHPREFSPAISPRRRPPASRSAWAPTARTVIRITAG
jgi:hypothetical protein